MPLEKFRQLQQQNALNQNQINLMNKFRQIPMNQNPQNPAIKPLIQNNVDQINQIQYPQNNLPHGFMQSPHGPHFGQIPTIPANQLQINNNPQNQIPRMNIIHPNGIAQNPNSPMNTPNKIPPNQNPQINKFPPSQNRINPNIPMGQVGINKLQQIGANLQQEYPIRKAITSQPNRANQQFHTLQTPIKSGQMGLAQPQAQMNQIAQIRQANTINQAKLNNNLPNKMNHPQIQINTAQKGLIAPQQQVKKIAIGINQVNNCGQLNPRMRAINGNRQLMHNGSVDYSNRRPIPKLGNVMPGTSNIVLVQPLQRKVVSPGRMVMRPNYQPGNMPNLLINKF
jgi:hypothetical protein